MATVVVLTFDNPDEAGRLRQTLRELEREGRLELDDAAVVVKDDRGAVRVRGGTRRRGKVGAVGGGVLGAVLFALFPAGAAVRAAAGAAIGAAGGALIGGHTALGLDGAFVEEVRAALRPGTSALFLEVRRADVNDALGALRPYKGTVFRTSLDPDEEEALRQALRARQLS
jgi:uncharacterized membrane protein